MSVQGVGPNSPYSELDSRQVTVQSFDEASDALRMIGVGGSLVPESYDNIVLTYVAAGNGAGEIQTVTYSLGSDVAAVLTLGYDASNRLVTVSKS